MNASTEVPVTVTPEAEARLAELGMRQEMEQMIAHVREVVPGLAAIEVTVAEGYGTRDEPGVTIMAYSDQVFGWDPPFGWSFSRQEVEKFPPDVLEHLCVLFSPGKPDAR